MTDFSYLDRNAEAAFDEVKRLMDRASYYKERKDKKQAFINDVDALSAYAKYAKAQTDAISVKMPLDIKYNTRNTAEIYAFFLYLLSDMLLTILKYYDDDLLKKAFFAEKIQMISQELDKYESELDADDLERTENLRIVAKSYQELIDSNQAELEELKNKPLGELDEQFAKIRSALTDISNTKICPVELDSTYNGCFIATAAYSTSIHPDLDTFRQFRDEKLLTNSLGKQLVSFYYKIGPKMAQYVETQPKIQVVLRQQLARLAEWMRTR